MKTLVEFRSTAFPPYDGEEEQINPGVFGERLAEFLAARLPMYDFQPGELIPEDWGWAVPLQNDDFPLWIGCGNYAEYPDGFLCFIEPHKPVVRRFFKKFNTRTGVESLQEAVDTILSQQGSITGKRWWTKEEFDKQALPPKT